MNLPFTAKLREMTGEVFAKRKLRGYRRNGTAKLRALVWLLFFPSRATLGDVFHTLPRSFAAAKCVLYTNRNSVAAEFHAAGAAGFGATRLSVTLFSGFPVLFKENRCRAVTFLL
jgi:hypothetical protein